MVRVVYENNEDVPVIITVYKPSADRYFEGGGNRDTGCFKGCSDERVERIA